MWTCKNCERVFEKVGQSHSCQKVPLGQHFKNKEKAKDLFDHLVERINGEIGKTKIISLPCCVHLFGKYDFLAALPKKNKLEIRFTLDRKLNSPRLKASVLVSTNAIKNCIDISTFEEIDNELIEWLNESYCFK
jgi:hypothetical protein